MKSRRIFQTALVLTDLQSAVFCRAKFRDAGAPYGGDVWEDLAKWARSLKTPAKAKAHVLSAAELAGFTAARLPAALSALSTASSQDDEATKRQPAVA